MKFLITWTNIGIRNTRTYLSFPNLNLARIPQSSSKLVDITDSMIVCDWNLHLYVEQLSCISTWSTTFHLNLLIRFLFAYLSYIYSQVSIYLLIDRLSIIYFAHVWYLAAGTSIGIFIRNILRASGSINWNSSFFLFFHSNLPTDLLIQEEIVKMVYQLKFKLIQYHDACSKPPL